MASNYERSLEKIKEKNGGTLPSELYLKTNAELGQILYNLTGDIKHTAGRSASKEILVKRIQRLTAPKTKVENSKSTKRTINESCELSADAVIANSSAPLKKPRNVLASLSETQRVQMIRVVGMTHDQVMGLQHDKHLRPLWLSIGMTAKYPAMTGKEKVFDRLKTFSVSNLTFYGLLPSQ